MQESLPLITIIVPMYNVELYIERCISSIQEQTYRNIEILLVDDGSPDKSGQLADEKGPFRCAN
jgi:glycosyltransferase involved in cell wall biosynthesis